MNVEFTVRLAERAYTRMFKGALGAALILALGARNGAAEEMTLHGVTRSTLVPMRVEIFSDTLMATGSLVVRHTDFGLTPISVAGVVKVKNEIAIDFKIEAAARTQR
jgi:hypothetical protein